MPFPFTPQLSDFVGPPENPLSEDGRWVTPSGLDPLRKSSSGNVTDSVHGDPNYSNWARALFPSEHGVECWGCTSGGQLGAAVETWRVCLWLEPAAGRRDGYLAFYGGGIGKAYVIRRYDDDGFTNLVSAGGGYPERLGIRINGDAVECWAKQSAGVWTLRCTVNDTTYRGDFTIGIGVEDPTHGGLGFRCFGGGIPRRSQFFRWTRGFKEPGQGTP